MYSSNRIEKIITFVLIVGTLISISLVMTGGIMYLLEHGNETFQSSLSESYYYHININVIWQNIQSYSPLGIIELGIVILVFTQILRVAILCLFYTYIKDYWFIVFSMFILITLIYSSFWRTSLY